jgi:hypothetical protein
MSTTIIVQNGGNASQNFTGNTSGVNMPAGVQTVEDMNRIISGGLVPDLVTADEVETGEPPAFGTHIREAVEIVKDWVGIEKK